VEEGTGGSGSVFRVELPAEAPEGTTVRPDTEPKDEEFMRQAMAGLLSPRLQAESAGPPPDAPVVLLVEDNPDMNRFLSDTLSETYRVQRAFDGQEGLEKALACMPDLILCDVMMPRMSGDGLVHAVRERSEFADVPIVLLTAKADDELRVRLLKEGAQDYLHKPFDTRTVLAKVDRLITDRRRRQKTENVLHRLSAGLLEAQDRERQLVARELNEHIAQCLSALGIYLQMAQKPAAAGIAEGMAVLQQCLTDVQKLSQALHPLMLDNLGLRAAIDWHVKGFEASSGIAVTLEAARGLGHLPGDGDLTLFRVLQDALERVGESGSRWAVVRAVRDAAEAALEVTGEDGTFSPREDDLQMAAARERLRNAGGRLEVTGSTLRAILPTGTPDPGAPPN
jgi:DNA-binding response OmpR family regulator